MTAASGLRVDGRAADAMRPVTMTPHFQPYAEGSVLIRCGETRVSCAVSIEDRVPGFLRGQGKGWITAEYAMLPRSTLTRTAREVQSGRPSGRTQEIQRLIGRSLRACATLELLGERTITIDCDVLQADAGTRTASITGAYVALHAACLDLVQRGLIPSFPLHRAVAAVSVGVIGGTPMLDLCYVEDRDADVDFNVVMTDSGEFVELQGTAEHRPFDRPTTDRLLDLATAGIDHLFAVQRQTLADWPPRPA